MAEHPVKPFVCPWWIGYFLISPLRRVLQDPETIVAPYVREGMTVLEIGPGMGFFSLPLARHVGTAGRVICVDVQERMIATLKRRAAKAGLDGRITTVVASADSLCLDPFNGSVDFTLAFAVVHEVPDHAGLFGQIHRAMKPGGLLLVSEPTGHVTEDGFRRTIEIAREKGFVPQESPVVWRSLSRILRKQ